MSKQQIERDITSIMIHELILEAAHLIFLNEAEDNYSDEDLRVKY
jgi:hypothetical protein